MATLETDAVPEPNFRALLLDIASKLGPDDLDALKYMFKDLLPPNKMNDAMSIFTLLEEKRLIQQGKMSLITQAFLKIGRNDLIHDLEGTDQEVVARDKKRGFPDGTVSPDRLVLFGIAQDLTPDEVEQAKFYFGDIMGKQKQGKIKNAFDLLTILEQLRPNDILDKLKNFLTQIERMDILQDLPDYRASKMPRRPIQEVHQDSGPVPEAPRCGKTAPPGSEAKKARSKDLFPGALAKANQGIDVEKASDMSLINEAAASVCSIGTNGTGFRVGDKCIMTAAHVLKEALDIPQEVIQDIQSVDEEKWSSMFKCCIQEKLNSTGIHALFTHDIHGQKCIKYYTLTTLRYVDVNLDTAVVELAPSEDGKPFPRPFTRFCEDYKGRFSLIGHKGDLTLHREHNCYTISDRGEFQRMKGELVNKGIPLEHLEVYDTFGKDTSFNQFHCSLRHGASGSPGVFVCPAGVVRVFTMLRAGYPLNPQNIHIDHTLCVEVGVSMTAICEHMVTTDKHLHEDIFCRD